MNNTLLIKVFLREKKFIRVPLNYWKCFGILCINVILVLKGLLSQDLFADMKCTCLFNFIHFNIYLDLQNILRLLNPLYCNLHVGF